MFYIQIYNSELSFWADNADSHLIRGTSWYFNTDKTSIIGKIDGKTTSIGRYLLGITDPSLYCDHIDGNILNNLRSNLRIVTRSQNNLNSRKIKGCTSCFKGVSKGKKPGDWEANVFFKGRKYHIGTFRNEEDAARARDEAARRIQGEFAALNFKSSKQN